MTLLFWGLTLAMVAAAIAVVANPFGKRKSFLGTPRIFVVIIVPLIAMGFYALLGSPNDLTAESRRSQTDSTVSDSQSGISVASVGSFVNGLKERLQQEPDDAGGWLLLARSYEHLGRHPEALLAYQRARSLGKTDVEFEKSLPGASASVQEVATNSDPALRGRVALSTEAATHVNSDDTIFIFAKESPEHRMPVVALRKPARDLPIDFVLTDAEVMVPGTHLADFESLVVTAKVSRSGLATDALDGLEVWSDPVSPIDGGQIELLITADSQAGGYRDE